MVFLLFNCICCSRDKIDFPFFIHRLAWLLLFISCVECTISIAQYFCQHSIGLRLLGEPSLQNFPFINPGKHRWLFDQFLSPTSSSDVLCRATGTFPHPNVLGGFLFCSLMASYYLCMKETSALKRSFLLGMILLQIFTLYIAYSRSAILALTLSTLIWCLLQFKEIASRHGLHFAAFKKVGLIGATVLAGAAIGLSLFYSQITARGGIVNSIAMTQVASTERGQYVNMAFEMIQEHPLLGVGFNNFQLYAKPTQAEFPGYFFHSKVHNIYLLIASETGLIGGALFLLFLLAILKTVWGRLKNPFPAIDSQEKIFLISAFLGILLIGGFDFYFIHTLHGRLLFFGFAALLYASSLKNREFAPILEGA